MLILYDGKLRFKNILNMDLKLLERVWAVGVIDFQYFLVAGVSSNAMRLVFCRTLQLLAEG